MALPLSGNQLKNLTTRLREGTETLDDRRILAEVLLYYHRVLVEVHADISRLCATMPNTEPVAPRVKTLKTLLEKFQRQPQLRSIAQVRDLAGCRVIVHGTRGDQDELADRVGQLFRDDERQVKVIDRRADPRFGYRAIHLEVRRDGIPVEIQIRTTLQHRWAELFERTADKIDRGLRYGEYVPIDDDGDVAFCVTNLQRVAELIDAVENIPDAMRRQTRIDLQAIELLDQATRLVARL